MNITPLKEKANRAHHRVLIVGIGNQLLGDEGVGLHIIDKLSQITLPPYVDIIDCGCDLYNVVSYLNRAQKVIIVDAICAEGKPGDIYRFDYSELKAAQAKISSVHQLGGVDVLDLLMLVYPCLNNCEITMIGIEPKTIKLGTNLSKEAIESMANVIRLVLKELSL